MNALKVIYYYFFAFYRKVDDEPYAMTMWAVSICLSLLLNYIIDLVTLRFCYFGPTWQKIVITLVILVTNYFVFNKSGVGRKIVNGPPPILVNRTVTVTLVILFFAISLSYIFVVPILAKPILEACRL